MGCYATPIKRKDNWTKYLLIHMNWNITDRELKTLIKKIIILSEVWPWCY